MDDSNSSDMIYSLQFLLFLEVLAVMKEVLVIILIGRDFLMNMYLCTTLYSIQKTCIAWQTKNLAGVFCNTLV